MSPKTKADTTMAETAKDAATEHANLLPPAAERMAGAAKIKQAKKERKEQEEVKPELAIDFDLLFEMPNSKFNAVVEQYSSSIDQIDKQIAQIRSDELVPIEKKMADTEQSATEYYWYLGKMLLWKRDTFRGKDMKGKWGEWLEARGIERTKSQRARDLADGYDSPDKCMGLTIKEALDLLKRDSEDNDDTPKYLLRQDELGPRGKIEAKLKTVVKLFDDDFDQTRRKMLNGIEDKPKLLGAIDEHIKAMVAVREKLAQRYAKAISAAALKNAPVDEIDVGRFV